MEAPGDQQRDPGQCPPLILHPAAWLRRHGADALRDAAPYPPVDLPTPLQVTGTAGSLVLAHYLLAHNIGGHFGAADDERRETVYSRASTRRTIAGTCCARARPAGPCCARCTRRDGSRSPSASRTGDEDVAVYAE
ncbi:hypothetical protein ACIRYZ_14140 [Kitasatospora sp. NPDC101155]|uniref:hypothetical protein n=1 Tax=Kitasatospora sp. NPDC101155 TaxID=3364097 RepID=UPI00382BE529